MYRADPAQPFKVVGEEIDDLGDDLSDLCVRGATCGMICPGCRGRRCTTRVLHVDARAAARSSYE